jgi:hypothetical protein
MTMPVTQQRPKLDKNSTDLKSLKLFNVEYIPIAWDMWQILELYIDWFPWCFENFLDNLTV